MTGHGSTTAILAALGLAIGLHANPLSADRADPDPHPNSPHPGHSRQHEQASGAELLFSIAEQTLLARFLEEQGYGYNVGGKPLPPGLQKQVARGKGLPPGWQDKVRRGQVLDNTLLDYARPLPAQWQRQLPPEPENTALYQLEDRIVRINTLTRAVLDIFYLTR